MSLLKVKLLNGRIFFNKKSKNFIEQSLLTIPNLHNKIFIVTFFRAKKFLAQNPPKWKFSNAKGVLWRNFIFKFFYLWKKFRPSSILTFESHILWFFLTGLLNRIFLTGRWNYMTLATKSHILSLWRFFCSYRVRPK